jgi:cytochrome c-type biogenesis protein CcmF
MTTFGNLLLAVAWLGAFASIATLIVGDRMGAREGEPLTNVGYIATFVIAAAMSLAVVVLLVGFFTNAFTMKYVAENHSTDVSNLAWLYKISGVWAGREGSLLFWGWLLSMFVGFVAWKRLAITDRLSNVAVAVANFVQMFFLTALFIPVNNPFQVTPPDWLSNGQLVVSTAMNPLLQHWAMILHPPSLFIGYAGLAIPFAYAIAAIIIDDSSKAWVQLSDRIAVFSWLFLGIGIGLGAIWAYVVLGWGGYWGWDPVENASLLPWLTGIALIHSMTVYKRRDGFKKWAVVMASVTFTLVLLGTFITRSGVIQSVHGFQQDWPSFWLFLVMMLIVLGAGVIGVLVRSKSFMGREEFESLTSKDASYYFNNVLMLVAAFVVAALTLSPAFGGPTFGQPSYNLLAQPVGIVYVLLMAVCPVLSWKLTQGKVFWDRVKYPLIGAVAIFGGLMTIYLTVIYPNFQFDKTTMSPLYQSAPMVYHVMAVIGLAVASWAIALPVWLFIDGARKRVASKGEGFLTALFNIFSKARTQSGGYVTHFGIGIVLVGLIGSAMYVQTSQFTLPQTDGAQHAVGGYVYVMRGLDNATLPNGDQQITVHMDVMSGGKLVGTASPGQLVFKVQQQTRLNADVIHEPLRDVFLVFNGEQNNVLSFTAKVNPMISWTWAGFLLMILGIVLALWPKRETS